MALTEKLLIPDTAIEPSFNTVLYTGNGSSSRSITGVGFQPDLVWIADRDAGNYNPIQDSVRGIDSVLVTALDAAEQSSSWINSYGQVTSFDFDGFNVSDGSGNTNSNFNQSGRDYVAWCFKAGGAASLNEEGTIDSQVSVNNDLGFSIVKWTANGSANDQLGHGLSTTPKIIIYKTLDTTSDWWTLTTAIDGSLDFLRLNSTAPKGDQSGVTISNTTIPNWNFSGTNMIAYCFHSVAGYSKVNTYTGTGTSGNVITTGFEPAFVIIKNTDDTGNWMIYDNVRDTDGVLNKIIYANLSNAEATATTATITPNTNGFTIGNSNSKHLNRLNDDFIYYAIANI
jgi:hypothetical protein